MRQAGHQAFENVEGGDGPMVQDVATLLRLHVINERPEISEEYAQALVAHVQYPTTW